MREILFRGKTLDGDWVFGFYAEPKTMLVTAPDRPEFFGYRCFNMHSETVGQYTGLKDRNGVKIFEGDIIRTEIGTIGDIQFSHGVFGIEWVHAKKERHMVDTWGQLHNLRRIDDGLHEKMEVIGNIHDNPELLNEFYLIWGP